MSVVSKSALLAAALCSAIAGGWPAPTAAQDVSRRPVRLLVPSPPGGPSDFAARLVAPQLRAGRMKAYGVTTAKRSPMLPDVPTIQEQGLEGYEFGNWHGLLAPKGTPDRIVRTLHREVARILEAKEIRDIVVARGNEIIANTPEEFAARLRRDIPRYRKIMGDAGIDPQ